MSISQKSKKREPVDLHVGSRLKSRRLQMKMSQTDLGDRVGITFQQIQKYEKGSNRISSSRLHQFASILEVPPTYFFEDPMGDSSASARPELNLISEFCASRDGLSLMKAFGKIKNKQMRHMIVKLVEEMVG